MASRSGILTAVKDGDIATLIQSTKELSLEGTLDETITSFSHRQLLELWDTLQTMLVQALQDTNMDCISTGELLYCVTRLARGTLTAPDDQELFVPPSLLQVAIVVHGILPSLTTEHHALKDDISRLFERWWTMGGHGSEELMGNTLMYLLARSTGPKSTKSDVARLYLLRHVLDSINLDHENASILVDLLLRCSVQPQFLDSAQGIKFLAHIFTLHPELTRKLHQTIKNHLPATPASWHSKFSEIYFRAWQEVKTPAMREILENDCIQDFMYRAVHAQRGLGQNSVAKILFRVLNFWHKKKAQKGVESMLTKLYEPILWRSVMVANSDVRINSAALMFDIFPLQDADLNREQSDAALQKQFDIMHRLLSDPVPEVRLTAVNGVGRVLNIYWELIPADVIKCFVTKLVDDLAYDISSPAVREAVLKSMHQLCDNHLCIPVLQNILPQLQNFVHDTSEKVRVVMFDLLLKVKGLRAIKFWNLVPVEHILARLQSDSAPVVRRIMKLVQPSFVPLHEPPAEQVSRCIALIKMNIPAARQFFLHLPHCLSLDDTVKFIIILCRTLIESARKLTGKNQEDPSSDGKETNTSNADLREDIGSKSSSKPNKKVRKTNENIILQANEQESDDEGVGRTGDDESLSDMVVFRGLVEAVYLMHTVILNELDMKDNKESLAKKLSVMVREVMAISKDPQLDEALIALAGHLPSRALPYIAQNLFKKLKSETCLNENINMKLIIKSLVLWGRAESVIQLVIDSLGSLLKKDKDVKLSGACMDVARNSKPKMKTVMFVENETKISPESACSIIKKMIGPAECRFILVTNHRNSLVALVDALTPVVTKLEDHLSGISVSASKTDLKLYFEVYTVFLRLIAFLCVSNREGNSDEGNSDKETDTHDHVLQILNKTLPWFRTSVMLHLNDEDVDHRDLAVTLLETILKICVNLMMVGLSEMSFLELAVELFKAILGDPGVSMSLRSCVLRGVYQLIQVLRYNKLLSDKDKTALLDDVGCFSVDCILKLLANHVAVFENQNGVDESDKEDDDDETEKVDSRNIKTRSQIVSVIISEVVEIILELTFPDTPPTRADKLVASVLQFVLKETNVHAGLNGATGKDGLPPLTVSFLAVFRKRESLKRIFFEELQKYLDVNDVSKICQVQGNLAILEAVKTDSADNLYAPMYQSLYNSLSKISISDLNRKMMQDLKRQIEDKLQKIKDKEASV